MIVGVFEMKIVDSKAVFTEEDRRNLGFRNLTKEEIAAESAETKKAAFVFSAFFVFVGVVLLVVSHFAGVRFLSYIGWLCLANSVLIAIIVYSKLSELKNKDLKICDVVVKELNPDLSYDLRYFVADKEGYQTNLYVSDSEFATLNVGETYRLRIYEDEIYKGRDIALINK